MVDVPKTPPVEVTKGTGPDQLPQGEATAQNEGAQFARELAKGGEGGGAVAPPDVTATLPGNPPAPLGSDPTTSFLYGDTKRPGEPLHRGVNAERGAVPPAIGQQWLGVLQSMLDDPTAPPAVRALYALLANTARV